MCAVCYGCTCTVGIGRELVGSVWTGVAVGCGSGVIVGCGTGVAVGPG